MENNTKIQPKKPESKAKIPDWTRAEELVLKHSDLIFDILIETIKKSEIAEYDAALVYFKHNPNKKATNPYERLVELCKRYIKHANIEYQKYLKKNNLKPNKKIDDNNRTVLKPIEQEKEFKE